MVDDQRLYEVKSATIQNFNALWLANYQANASAISRSYGVSSLFEKFDDIPGIAVGAGPSLDKNLQWLEAAQGKAIIICVDTILSAVTQAGITPNIVITLDPQQEIAPFFHDIDSSRRLLVAPTITHPNTLSAWKGEVVFYNKFAPDIPQLTKIAQLNAGLGYLTPGGTVLSVALDLLFRMGANPIGFMGQDLSYPSSGPAYSQGTLYGDGAFQELYSDQLDDMVKDTDIFGKEVFTKKSMFITKQWMEWAFTTWKRKHPAAYYNLTEGGIVTKECHIVTLAEWILRFCGKKKNLDWALKKALRRKKR